MGMDFDPIAGMGEGNDDDNDDDFEAELAALQGGLPQKKRSKPKKSMSSVLSVGLFAVIYKRISMIYL